jgi:hypothetical protein
MITIGESLPRKNLSVRNSLGLSISDIGKFDQFLTPPPLKNANVLNRWSLSKLILVWVKYHSKSLLMFGFSHNFKQNLWVTNLFSSQVMKNNTLLI